MKPIRYIFLIVLMLQGAGSVLYGQMSANMAEYEDLFRTAQEMYEKQMWSTAQQSCQRILEHCGDLPPQARPQWLPQAAFYSVDCSYQLNAPNTELQLKQFVREYSQSVWANDAYFLLAKLYFRASRYPEAAETFRTLDASALRNTGKSEYYFKYGYALFVQEKLDEAAVQFDKIKNGDNRYASVATYYSAHIAYEQKNYNNAIKGFEQLRNDEMFASLVPYYIIHIAHLQRNYDRIISEGKDFMNNVSNKRLPEIARIIGEAYYFKQQYDKALPYIEKFVETSPLLTRSDRYLLGYIYYQNREYPKAVKLFEQIVAGNDSLAQMAHYYLADAWLHVNEKYSAGRAFSQAGKMDFMPEIKEDAMYNYAKLMFELKSGPFTDAIDALTQYQQAYPSSPHTDEITRYLMQAYMWSRNYKAAWLSLKTIKNSDAEVLSTKQTIAYYLAVELIQNQEFEEAIHYLDTSLYYAPYNPLTASLSLYWKGEAQFRLKNYDVAADLFNEFVLSPSVYKNEEYKTAHYSVAYCYYKTGAYETAHTWFRKFIALNSQMFQLVCDANCRIGDYYFRQQNYRQAIENYQKVISASNATDVDYAMFQSGLCYGLLQNTDKKLELMNKVIAYLPKSPYSDNAKFEKGRTYSQMQNYPQAIAIYQELLQKKESVFYSKTLLELGLIYVNQGKPSEAMKYYKQVAEQYPSTPEMRTALVGVRNIYVELGDASGYFQYAASFQSIEASERDSVSFAAAEHAYSSEDQTFAVKLLTQYINDFPRGAFLLDANFYLANACLNLGKNAEAIPYYEATLKYPKNDYTENALDALSMLVFNLEQYDKSLTYYTQLAELAGSNALLIKGRRGKMLSNYMLKRYTEAIEDASKLLSCSNLPPETKQEGYYVRAKCYEQIDNTEKAIADFALIAANTKSKEGANAKYKMIENWFNKGDFDRVESEVINFSKSGSQHQYWIARAFILLGDVYVQRNDAFQAKATYESIMDGYGSEDDGIKDAVRQRVQRLLARENEKDKAAEQSPVEIPVGDAQRSLK